MNLGGSQEVGSIHATVGLNTDDLRRGLDQAKAALSESARMTQDALRFTNELAKGIDREADATRRASLLKQQQAGIDRELAAAKAQLGAALSNEDRIVGQVRAKYSLLSEARRAELIEVKQQIAAQDALAAAAVKAANAQAAAQRNIGRNLQAAGRGLTGAVTTPIVGAALAAGYAGQQVQQAEAGIRAGTGLTGGALQGVEESFRRIAPQVSQPLNEVGQAVAELERRTGLTGTALEKLAVSELNLQRITQSGKEIFKDSAQLFTAWNIPVAQQIPLLDELNRAHQLTGISVTQLMQAVTRTAPTFRAMGKSVEDSVATFASFNKAGIVPERLITALNAGLGRLAKAGVPDAARAMGDMLQRIQNLRDPTQALNEAVRLLGVRGGTQLADALRTGKLSLQSLEQQIVHGSDTIAKAAKDTETFSVVWGRMRNAVEIALAPLGEAILKFIVLGAQAIRPAVEALGRALDAFSKLPEGVQLTTLGVLAFAAALGPAISGLGRLVVGVQAISTAFAEGGALQVGLGLIKAQFAEVSAAGLLSAGVLVAGFGAVALGIYAISQNLDSLKIGLGTLSRLPGNLAQGYGISRSFEKSMQQSVEAYRAGQPAGDPMAAAKKALSGAAGGAYAVPGGVPGLTDAERQALYGKGKAAKKMPEEEESERATQLIAKNARIRQLLAEGESVGVARLGSEYLHLSKSQLEAVESSQRLTDAAIKAAESQKQYAKDLPKIEAQIRRLKAGHDAEAGGLDALKEKYPGLSTAVLQHMFATQQYELHLQKQHEAQQRVNEAVRTGTMRFMEATAATRTAAAAVALFGEQMLKKFPHLRTPQDVLRNLTPQQLAQAQRVGVTGAETELGGSLTQLRQQNAAMAYVQPTQQRSMLLFGKPLGDLTDPQKVKDINEEFRRQMLAERQQAAAQAFMAPVHAENQVIGTIDEQFQRLQEQFGALTGKTTLARETMQKFGVVLKDLPKDTQQSLRAFFELQRGLDFFQNFANGVQSVFQNMFTNLAEHGFKGFFRSVVQGFQQMLQQMAAQYLASQLANVFMNLVGGFFGSVFGGAPAHRQGGGPLAAGQASWVGEGGPELYVPRQSGTVIPHAQLAGVGGTTINLHVHGVTDAASFRAPHNQQAIWSDLHREIDRAHRRGR